MDIDNDNDCFLNKYFDLFINITDVNKSKEAKVFLLNNIKYNYTYCPC